MVPCGIGSYPLLEHAGVNRDALVDEIFAQALSLGRGLIRTNAFFDEDGQQHSARTRDGQGVMLESGLQSLDRLLAKAAEQNVRLILLLTNNWKDYGGAPAVVRFVAPQENLSKDAFWSDPRAIEAQHRFIQALITRVNTVNGRLYAEDPTVWAWELANEARCDDPQLCEQDTLRKWAVTMASAVRSAGASQPIAWGGQGFLGEHGEDLEGIARDGAVDILTLHHYSNGGNVEAAISGGYSAIAQRAEIAQHYGRALLVEEMGLHAQPGFDVDGARARVLSAWVAYAHQRCAGTLPWMIAERDRKDYDGYLIRPYQDAKTAKVLTCLKTDTLR